MHLCNICFLFIVFLQREHLKIAQQYFQLVGGSASECGKISYHPKKQRNVIFPTSRHLFSKLTGNRHKTEE